MTSKELQNFIDSNKNKLIELLHPTFGRTYMNFTDIAIEKQNQNSYKIFAQDQHTDRMYLAEGVSLHPSEILWYLKGLLAAYQPPK